MAACFRVPLRRMAFRFSGQNQRVPCRGFVVVGLAAILTGCNDTSKQRSLAVAAAQHFQSLYNSGLCSQMYDDAGRYFQAHETRRRWLRDCDQLRKRFGFWSQFTPTSSAVWPVGQVGIVWVRGPARFESGPAEVRLDWNLTNGHAALFNVLIEAGGEQISVPGFTGEFRD